MSLTHDYNISHEDFDQRTEVIVNEILPFIHLAHKFRLWDKGQQN